MFHYVLVTLKIGHEDPDNCFTQEVEAFVSNILRDAYGKKRGRGADISIVNQSYEVNVPPCRCIC